MRKLNLLGERFGRLVVTAPAPARVVPSGKRQTQWECECDCGRRSVVSTAHLRSGHTRSCGCGEAEARGATQRTHGLRDHPLYQVWVAMRRRCYRKADPAYYRYGGRGITVCDRWLGKDGFENFLEDMGERPPDPPWWTSRKAYWSLDRINNDGPYSPDNCRWASPYEQRMNQRPRTYRRAS